MKTMKYLLISGMTLLLAGCARDKMSKDKLVNDCLKNFTKKNEAQKLFSQTQLGLLCDCMADKFIAKYKSMKEADNDPEGARQIGKECGEEVMSK